MTLVSGQRLDYRIRCTMVSSYTLPHNSRAKCINLQLAFTTEQSQKFQHKLLEIISETKWACDHISYKSIVMESSLNNSCYIAKTWFIYDCRRTQFPVFCFTLKLALLWPYRLKIYVMFRTWLIIRNFRIERID